MKRINHIDFGKAIFIRVIFSYEKECHDEWRNDSFKFYFKVCKLYSLKGIYYKVYVPDASVTNKNLFIALNDALLHMNDDSPRYCRLKEELMCQNKWQSLGSGMKKPNKGLDIEMNQIADDAIEKMREMSLKDMEDLVLNLPNRVAKLILVKMIRNSD